MGLEFHADCNGGPIPLGRLEQILGDHGAVTKKRQDLNLKLLDGTRVSVQPVLFRTDGGVDRGNAATLMVHVEPIKGDHADLSSFAGSLKTSLGLDFKAGSLGSTLSCDDIVGMAAQELERGAILRVAKRHESLLGLLVIILGAAVLITGMVVLPQYGVRLTGSGMAICVVLPILWFARRAAGE